MVLFLKFNTNKNFLVETLSEWIQFRHSLTDCKAKDVRLKYSVILAWEEVWTARADFLQREARNHIAMVLTCSP